MPVENAQAFAIGFKVETAPRGIEESRVIIESHADLIKLENLIIACFDNVMRERVIS